MENNKRSFIFSGDFESFKNQPFLQCHGSTLARLPSGQFVCAWFAGTKEMHPDTAIWWSVQVGDQWSQPLVACKVSDEAHWNPVLFVDKDGQLIMHFKVGRFPDSWDTYKTKLSNNIKWQKPKLLPSKMLDCGKVTMGPVRNKMITLSNGTVIAPSSIEKVISRIPYRVEWNSIFHVSSNGGKTWKTTDIVGYDREKYGELGGIIQPALWETNGKIEAFFRSTSGRLFRSHSTDGGMTWDDVVMTDIPNPNSAVDVAVNFNRLAMVYNPVNVDWGRRSPISISFSNLDGNLFGEPITIERGVGGYSYPAIIATDYGFALTYTWSRRRIAFTEVKITEVQDDGCTFKVEMGSSIKPYNWV